MPTYTITNYSSTQFQLTIDGDALLFKKVYASTYVQGDYLLLFCQQVETNSFRQQYVIHYTDCTDPSAASAADLKDAVDFIIDSYANYAETILLEVRNVTGSPITKGTPVYITGTVGATQVLTVAPADASDSAKMPATGLMFKTLANNQFGHVIVSGLLTNIQTTPIDGVTGTVNATVYVKPGGGLTLTKPTGTGLIQNVGKIGRVSGGNSGSIAVSNIQRSNDIPNLAQNKLWIGNSSGVPAQIEIGTGLSISGGYLNASGGGGGGTYSVYQIDYDGDITGARDGVNDTYTTSATFLTGSLKVWLNGVLLSPGATNDYTIVGSDTFEMNYAPLSTDVFSAEYLISTAPPVPGGFDPELTMAYLSAY